MTQLAVMRLHSTIGHDLLSGSDNRFMQTGALIALRHHDRYNGSDHPDRLTEDEILLEARIAAADVFDALISPRPYKHAREVDDALTISTHNEDAYFASRRVDSLICTREQVDYICQRFSTTTRRPGGQ
jgi:two-component system response regulator RpfG